MADGTASGEDRKRAAAAIGLALVFGLAIRIALAGYSPWVDEFASLIFARHPLSLLWSDWMLRETNPPLFYSLLHGWLAAGAETVRELRLLPILCGMAGVATIAAIAWRSYGPRAAVIVALLAALSASNVFYSQQLRGYILAFDGVALSLWGLLLIIEPRAAAWKGLLLYALGCTIAIYAHTTLFLWPLIATIACCLASYRQLWLASLRLPLRLLAANLLVLAATAWWLWLTALQLAQDQSNIEWIRPLGLAQALGLIVTASSPLRANGGLSSILAVLLLAAAAVSAWFTWHRQATRLLVAIAGCGVVVLCAAELYRPILLERTVFWLSIVPLLLIAGALGAVAKARLRAALVGGLALLLAMNLAAKRDSFETQDWTGALERIAREPRGVLVVEHEVMGLAAAEACRVTFPRLTLCPVRIVTVRDDRRASSWSAGLMQGQMIALGDLASGLQPGARVYLLHHGRHDLLATVQSLGAAARPGARRQFLEGPFAPESMIPPGGFPAACRGSGTSSQARPC